MMRLIASSLALAHAACGLLELPISQRDGGDHMPADVLERRSLSIAKREVGTNLYDVYSWSYAGAYYTNVTIGTPPQLMSVIVANVGDTYFDAYCTLPSTDLHSCRGGVFNPGDSSTYEALNSTFNITYQDNTQISGPYSIDVIGIGDVLVAGTQFVTANTIISNAGYAVNVLGLGYSSTEEVQNSSLIYPNIPEVLVYSGVTQSRLFSLSLGSGSSSATGSLLFGAIDNSKYSGPLVTMNVLPTAYNGKLDSQLSRLIVPLTSASVHTSNNYSSLFQGGPANASAYNSSLTSLPVELSPGGLVWYVPSKYYYQYIRPALSYVDVNGTCPCSSAQDNHDYISLTFGGRVSITVNVSQMIMPVIDQSSRQPVFYNNTKNETTCYFAVFPQDDTDFWALGVSVLRSMYVVFDLDNGQVSIAQAITNVTASPSIVEVKSGPNGVASAAGPSAVPEASNSYGVPGKATKAAAPIHASRINTPVGTATGLAAIPVNAQVFSSATGAGLAVPSTLKPNGTTATGAASSSAVPPPGPNNAGAIAGGVVGGVAGLALIVGAVYYYLRRRKERARQEPMHEVQTEWVGTPRVDGSINTMSPRLGKT